MTVRALPERPAGGFDYATPRPAEAPPVLAAGFRFLRDAVGRSLVCCDTGALIRAHQAGLLTGQARTDAVALAVVAGPAHAHRCAGPCRRPWPCALGWCAGVEALTCAGCGWGGERAA